MIDENAQSELARTFAAALGRPTPEERRSDLIAAGWLDALEMDEPASVRIAGTLEGERLTETGLVDDVMAHRLRLVWANVPVGAAVAHSLAVGPDGYVVRFRSAADRPLVCMDPRAGRRLRIIAPPEQPASGSQIGGLDPDLGLQRLDVDRFEPLDQLAGRAAEDAWRQAVAGGQVVVARQVVAGALHVLTLAVDHSRDRRQFGVPIMDFQAIRHRLADAAVAVAAADAMVEAAAANPTPVAAAVAKIAAGTAAEIIARHCLQVFGGIGFTSEHPFHRHARRHAVLDRLLGSRTDLQRSLGRDVRVGLLRGERVLELDAVLLAGGPRLPTTGDYGAKVRAS